jgi:hypothetical protein
MELQILTNLVDIKKMYQMIVTSTTSNTSNINSTSSNIYSFNLYFIKDEIIEPRSCLTIDLGIQCILKKLNNSLKLKTTQLYTYEPFWIIPNKFITKTPLISQNSPNLIEPNVTSFSCEPNVTSFSRETVNGVKDPIIVSLFNNSDKPYKITTGMSLFKLVVCNDKINKINLI